MSWLTTLNRILNGVMDAYNRKKKRDASDSPAEFISDRVQQSDKKFSDLAAKPKRDRAE